MNLLYSGMDLKQKLKGQFKFSGVFAKQKVAIALNQEHMYLDTFIETYKDEYDDLSEDAQDILLNFAKWSGQRLKEINN